MKSLVSGVAAYVGKRSGKPNTRLLLRFMLILLGIITVYAVVFHWLMEYEGQRHSWITGFYWTLTVMSTLGFGDITFASDAGRIFSMVVMISGVIFLLVLMPFTLIEFFYAPWMERQSKGRIPNRVPEEWKNHIILTDYDAITRSLMKKLDRFHQNYVVLCEEQEEAISILDRGVLVIQGDLSMPDIYQRAGIERASLVAVTGDDVSNANTAFTVREIHKTIPIACTASGKAPAEVIRLAGGSIVFQLGEMMGEALARRVVGGGAASHIIGGFDKIQIAETAVRGTELVGKTVAELELPLRVGVNVIGIWDRGGFSLARPDSLIEFNTVMMLSGTQEQLEAFDTAFMHMQQGQEASRVIVVGGGRVGIATAAFLARLGVDYRIIELEEKAVEPLGDKAVHGNAAHFHVLQKAGIIEAESVVITSNNDEMDIYLTIFCRKLRPDIQIISRATAVESVPKLHRAGADIVMSYASMGSNQIFNYLQKSDTLMIAEGLSLFRAKLPETTWGSNLIQLGLRASTGCNVVAVTRDGVMQTRIDPRQPLDGTVELLLIGDRGSEERFYQRFPLKKG